MPIAVQTVRDKVKLITAWKATTDMKIRRTKEDVETINKWL
jgi:hypothetical protein